ADASLGFSTIGRSAGISPNSKVVVFSADLTSPRGPTARLDPGPGIFARVVTDAGTTAYIRLTGVSGNGHRDPGETWTDTNKNGQVDPGEDSGPIQSFDYLQRVAANDTSATFLALDKDGQKALFSVQINYVDPNNSVPTKKDELEAIDIVEVAHVGQTISVGATALAIKDLSINDPINRSGQLVFWASTDQGDAVFRANALLRPVLFLPGIAGTMPVDSEWANWLMKRGFDPEKLREDPLLHSYDDLILTLQNAGYKRDVDLFVANYDWRMTPAPSPPAGGPYDGVIDGLTGSSITDNTFEYGVDYLGYYLAKAVKAWTALHPSVCLDSVDIIAHSTGGLIARSYIQSSAYNAIFPSGSTVTTKLPRFNNLIMVGVPNLGASKAFNALNDNWNIGVDIIDSAAYVFLSSILKQAYEKVIAGTPITGPHFADVISGPISPEKFIQKYVPTLRGLMATYDFIDWGSGTLHNTNSDPELANDLIQDLNAGKTTAVGDTFVSKVLTKPTVLYGTSVRTATTVLEETGPKLKPTLFPLVSWRPTWPDPGQVWYSDVGFPGGGDGTVPIFSSASPFQGDSRVLSVGFSQGNVHHQDLTNNPEIQKTILWRLGRGLSTISTGHSDYELLKMGKIVLVGVDPVDAVLVDDQGRRLGYTQADGPLNEIPNSVYYGVATGLGLIYGDGQVPTTLKLTGTGDSYSVFVTAFAPSSIDGFGDSATLAVGEVKTLTYDFASLILPPVAIDDTAATSVNLPVQVNVLNNDTDADGQIDPASVAVVAAPGHGMAVASADGTITYTPNTGFLGTDTFTYLVCDTEGRPSNEATVTVRMTDGPVILGLAWLPGTPADRVQFAIDFSTSMAPAPAQNETNYLVSLHNGASLAVTSATYTDTPTRHRVVLTAQGSGPLPEGTYDVSVDGASLRSAAGVAMAAVKDQVLVEVPGNNTVVTVGQNAQGDYSIQGTPSSFGYAPPTDVSAADYTGDGIADLVVMATTGSGASSDLILLEGHADGSYAPPRTIMSFEHSAAVSAVDWNQDYKPDLAILTYEASLHILVNDGSGHFAPAPDTPIPVPPGSGAAKAGTDYVATSGDLLFQAGETSKTMTVFTIDDNNAMGDKAFSVLLSAPDRGATLGTPSALVVTVLDGANPGRFQFIASGAAVTEGKSTTLTVLRTDGSDGAVTVHYATADSTAKAGVDYLPATGDLLYLAGETIKTVTVFTLDDQTTLGDKAFSVFLSAPGRGATLGTPSAVVVTVVDGKPGWLQFNPPAAAVTEGQVAALTVTRTSGSDGLVTVNYATANGTAAAGVDYVATSGTLVFQPGETVKTIAIATLDDNRIAGNKTFSVILSAPGMGATLGAPSATTVTVVDGAPGRLQFSASTAAAKEGQAATLIVTRTGGSAGFVSVHYATANATGRAGVNYVKAVGDLTLQPGETSRAIAIATRNDGRTAGNKTFRVVLSAPKGGAALGSPNTATVTVVDAQPGRFQFSTSKAVVNEGQIVTLTVTRTKGGDGLVTVRYATSNSTAKAGVNYAAAVGALTFQPGETVKTVAIKTIDDGRVAGNKTFRVNLSVLTKGATRGTPSAVTVSILDSKKTFPSTVAKAAFLVDTLLSQGALVGAFGGR
ncbi:MAG: Calx-beta domain-containing protein, partial [Isosphaeraceae bacterium]